MTLLTEGDGGHEEHEEEDYGVYNAIDQLHPPISNHKKEIGDALAEAEGVQSAQPGQGGVCVRVAGGGDVSHPILFNALEVRFFVANHDVATDEGYYW